MPYIWTYSFSQGSNITNEVFNEIRSVAEYINASHCPAFNSGYDGVDTIDTYDNGYDSYDGYDSSDNSVDSHNSVQSDCTQHSFNGVYSGDNRVNSHDSGYDNYDSVDSLNGDYAACSVNSKNTT